MRMKAATQEPNWEQTQKSTRSVLAVSPVTHMANATSLSPATSPSFTILLWQRSHQQTFLLLFTSYVRSECNQIIESQQDAALHSLQGAHRSSQLHTNHRRQGQTKTRTSNSTFEQHNARRVHRYNAFRRHDCPTPIDEMCRHYHNRRGYGEASSPSCRLH